MHLRIEIGRWWLQIDHPTPQVVYTPEHGVGFYRLPDETD